MRRAFQNVLCFLTASASLWNCAVAQDSEIRFQDVTVQTGIDFVHSDGNCGPHYLFETVTGGIATFDYDGDGRMDIYFTSGLPAHSEGLPPPKRLFRNLGAGKFADVTQQAGIADNSYSLGAVVGDYDNDGDVDLFVNNYGSNHFYVNNGDGTFTKPPDSPLELDSQLGSGAAFLDIEGDGDLDLYIGNYVVFTREQIPHRLEFGKLVAPGPRDYKPEFDFLFRNDGDGTFSNISVESGIHAIAGTSMGLIALDYDQDGDSDLFVCNDAMENFLWQNDGQGHFTEMAQILGVAYDVGGAAQASMGVDAIDFNNDGWLDLVATNFDSQVPNLYCNMKGDYFDDLSVRFGLGLAARDVKWGVAVGDFDKDSWNDLYIATGHLFDGAVRPGNAMQFASKNRLFRSVHGAGFEEVVTSEANAMSTITVSRGVAAEDMDNDGDIDLVVSNLNSAPLVLENVTDSTRSWLKILPIGTVANRDAVGTTVIVRTRYGQFKQHVCRGRGYQSHYGNWLFFGLANATQVEEVEIQWHAGARQIISFPPINSELKIVQQANPASGAP